MATKKQTVLPHIHDAGDIINLSGGSSMVIHGSAWHTGTIGDHATNLTGIGTNTHTQIDDHISAAAPHSGHAATAHNHDASYSAIGHDHDSDYEQLANKGAASGYAELDASALVPSDQLGTGGAGLGAKFLADDQAFKTVTGTGTASDVVTAETSFGAASAAGSESTYSRGDHTHGTPYPEDYARTQNDGRLVRDSATQLSWDGYQVGIYDSTNTTWKLVKPSSTPTLANTANDIDGNALTYSVPYDIFAEYSSDTALTLVAKKWTNDTTRAVSPAKWHGRYCYDNSTDDGKKRLWVGTIRLINSSGAKFADDSRQRFVWNKYNQKMQVVCSSNTTSTTYAYSTNTWREAYGGTGQVRAEVVLGEAQDIHYSQIMRIVGTNKYAEQSIGVNSTTAPGGSWLSGLLVDGDDWSFSLGDLVSLSAGYSYVTIVEKAGSAASVTFYCYEQCRVKAYVMV